MKNILVTGSSVGLGKEISRLLLSKGFRVIGVARTKLEKLNKCLNHKNFHYENFDFEKVDDIHNFYKAMNDKYGRFYGLVNNAAIGTDGVLNTMHETDIKRLIRINIEAPILMTKYFSRGMLLSKEGKIVNIASIIGSTGFSGLSVYGASKSAIIGFTKSLSRELGKMNINVNAVSPGYMKTNMTKTIDKSSLEKIIRRSPQKKLASTKDVAQMVYFLISSDGDSINGENITIDVGSTA